MWNDAAVRRWKDKEVGGIGAVGRLARVAVEQADVRGMGT